MKYWVMAQRTWLDCANNTSFEAGQTHLDCRDVCTGDRLDLGIFHTQGDMVMTASTSLDPRGVVLCVIQSLRKLSWQPLQAPPVAAKAVLRLSKLPVLAAALSLVASA